MNSPEQLIEKIRTSFDPSAELVKSVSSGIPDHWQAYLSTSDAERQIAVRNEIAMFSNYFPITAKALRLVITDAFLVKTNSFGLCRFFIRQLKGQYYLAFSRTPKHFAQTPNDPSWNIVQQNAPEALTYVYEHIMDGLSDLYGFAGPKTSILLSTVQDEVDTYSEQDWYKEFITPRDPNRVIEIFSSGGGAFMLLDLNENLKKVFEPQAYIVSTKDPEMNPRKSVDFFPYLDEWMAIGLAQYEG